jgi:hypothetical protein
MKLYMFRTVPLSIIRNLFTVHSTVVYVIQVCRQLSSRSICWRNAVWVSVGLDRYRVVTAVITGTERKDFG